MCHYQLCRWPRLQVAASQNSLSGKNLLAVHLHDSPDWMSQCTLCTTGVWSIALQAAWKHGRQNTTGRAPLTACMAKHTRATAAQFGVLVSLLTVIASKQS
jgi:hypothetical protein